MTPPRAVTDEGTEHLREVDPVMRGLIDEYGPVEEVLGRLAEFLRGEQRLCVLGHDERIDVAQPEAQPSRG